MAGLKSRTTALSAYFVLEWWVARITSLPCPTKALRPPQAVREKPCGKEHIAALNVRLYLHLLFGQHLVNLGRRRKQRCIFAADDPTICTTCRNKGFQCIEQRPEQLQVTPVDNRLNLKDRVAKLEAIIQSLAPGDASISRPENGPTDLPTTPLSLDKVVAVSPNAGKITQMGSTSGSSRSSRSRRWAEDWSYLITF